jgi:hypothetical protein
LCLAIVAAVVLKRRAQEKTRPLSHAATGPSLTFVIENPLFPPSKQMLELSPVPDGLRASQLGDGSPHAAASWDTLRYDTGSGGADTYAAVVGVDRKVKGEWGQLNDTGTAAGHLVVPVECDAYEYGNTGDAATDGNDDGYERLDENIAAKQRLEQPWAPTYDLVDRPHGTQGHTGRASDPDPATRA